MEKKIKTILIVAGEASGDLHASCLVRAIKDIYPEVEFFGLGGSRLKEEAVRLYCDIVSLAVVGFFEVLRNLGEFRAIFKGLLSEVDRRKPQLAILVDYPGFNLRLAGELKKRQIPIIYYISPQVWAWGERRLLRIRKLIERMIVIFKFEEALYQKHNIPVSFVGHPLLDTVKPNMSKEEFFHKLRINPNTLTFAMLPGSREKEVKKLLPIMLKTAEIIYKKKPNSSFLLLRSPTVEEEIFQKEILHYKLPIYILENSTYDGINASDFAIVASGTATLETAILGVPMVILYKVSFLTWAYLKTIIKIPYIGLVNVVAGKKIIAEFLQFQARPKKVADYILQTLKDKQGISQIKQDLAKVKNSLGENGASIKAGRVIADFLRKDEGRPD